MEMDEKKGKVWLVGAGPSDAGLFTLKGKRTLEQADVVVYDKLVGQGIMAMIPSHVRTISVGKVAGHHPIPQHEINRILLDEALKGNRVVRLKGGDPFVFGRGGEELELLCQHQIPFEIVPGITSAVSVPAYNGIPVTHRDCCSSLHIITGHTKKAEEADVDFEALVRLKGTLVFLMSVTSMGKLCKGLLDAGMRSDMPAAILERGTTAHQRRVISDISNLPSDAKAAAIGTPAIIVVGEVCALSEKFHWAEDRSLGGLKIAITRPADRSSTLGQKLQDLGAEVVYLPAIETTPIAQNKALEDALNTMEQYTWIVFTSVAGVKAFYDKRMEMKLDIRKLAGLKFAAIGTATKKAIEEKGILVDLMPEVYSGAALGECLAKAASHEDRILIPRAKIGTDEVIKPLETAGLTYVDLPVYDTKEGVEGQVNGYDDSVDYVAFTSASTVRGFVKLNPQADYSKIKALCIGQQTAAEASKYQMKVEIANKATIDSMIQLLLELKK